MCDILLLYSMFIDIGQEWKLGSCSSGESKSKREELENSLKIVILAMNRLRNRFRGTFDFTLFLIRKRVYKRKFRSICWLIYQLKHLFNFNVLNSRIFRNSLYANWSRFRFSLSLYLKLFNVTRQKILNHSNTTI